jgi:hypothetical protein
VKAKIETQTGKWEFVVKFILTFMFGEVVGLGYMLILYLILSLTVGFHPTLTYHALSGLGVSHIFEAFVFLEFTKD